MLLFGLISLNFWLGGYLIQLSINSIDVLSLMCCSLMAVCCSFTR